MNTRLGRFIVSVMVSIMFFGIGLLKLAEAEVPTGAVAYWKFDECSGTVISDETTYSNDGALIDSPVWSTGISGCDLIFDGTADYATVSNSTSLNPGNAITVEVWAKSDTTIWNENSAFVYKADAYKLVPVKDTKILGFYIYDNGWQSVSYTSSNNITSWHHYVATYDGTKLKIYEDAAKKNDTTYSGAIDSSTDDLYMGYNGSAYFQGSLDEVVVYSSALTDTDVEERYLSMKVHATIDSISPSPAYEGEMVCFAGHGDPAPGLSITDYRWISDISGQLSKSDSFCNNNLSAGVHTISFSAEDSDGDWSLEDSWLFTVNAPPANASDLALEGTDIFFSDPNPASGSVTNITATIHNIGNTISNSSIYVNFYYDDSSTISNHTIGNYTISNAIAAGASDTASIAWTVPNQDDCYIAKVEVAQDANEYNINNNNAARFITVGSPGSCVNIEVDFEPSSYTVCNGQAFYVNGKAEYVWGNGTRYPVLGADVAIDHVDGSWQTHTVTYGDFSKKITAPQMESGSPEIKVTATDHTLVGNTAKNITMSCPPYAKDLTTSPLQIFPQGPINANYTLPLSAYIINVGYEDIYSDFSVSYEIEKNNLYRETLVSDTVYSHSEIPVEFGNTTFSNTVKTTYTSKVIVDVYDEIAEDREYNNTITNQFDVYPVHVDLKPAAIYPETVSVCNGGSVTNQADIYNVGGVDSGEAIVYFGSVSNETVGNVTVSNVSKWEQEEETVSFQWAPSYPSSFDTYNVWVGVSCADENTAQTANNLYSSPVFVYPAPGGTDLWPKDISYPTLYKDNESVFTTTVENTGCTTSSATYVEFTVDSTVGTTHLDSLAPGAVTTVNYSYTFQNSGIYTFCADTKETENTSNNVKCKSVTVHDILPDLKVESADISFSDANPTQGNPTDIYATIHNLGTGTATNYFVDFYEYETVWLDGEDVTTPLAPGGTYISSLSNCPIVTNWVPDDSGTNIIKIAVSPVDPGDDANYENNEATRYVGINISLPVSTVAYWKFDEGYGTIASDETENHNDGTIYGATWVPGIKGSALYFDGTGDYVEVQDSSSLDITGAVTIEAWVKLDSYPSSWSLIAIKGDTGIIRNYGMQVGGGSIYLSYRNGAWYNLYTTGQAFNLGSWHHVVGVIDTTNDYRAIYINGALVASSNSSIPAMIANNETLFIGSKAGAWPTDGTIDEFVMYNQALSSSDVLNRLSEFDDKKEPTFSGLGSAVDIKTGGLVNLFWDAASDDDGTLITYNIYYATTSGGQNFSTPNATTTNTSYLVTGLTDDQDYYFVVRANDVFGNKDKNTVEIEVTPTNSLHSGTVGYWKFDEGSGTIANDETGWGNDGIINGATWTSPGITIGNALDFDGTGDYVEVQDSSSLDITGAVTIEAWVKLDSYPSSWSLIAIKGDTGINRNYGMQVSGEVIYLSYRNGAWYNLYTTGQAFTLGGGWHHVVGVIDTTNDYRAIYVNGALFASSNSAIPAMIANDESLFIGSKTGAWPSDGVFDEVHIYNQALSSSDVLTRLSEYDDGEEPTFSGLESAVDIKTGGLVNLSWDAASDDDGTLITYNVYYATTCDNQIIFSNPNASTTNTSYLVSGLTNDQVYYFGVRAKDAFGNNETNTVVNSATPTGSSPSGAMAHWKFDEGSGTIANDETGWDNDGTINGATWTSSGITIGNALDFDGTDDYVSASFSLPTTATFEMWATWTGTQPKMLFLTGPNGSGPDLFFYQDKLSWNTWNGASNSFGDIPSNASDGGFHHYVVVVESGVDAKLYYDGTLLGTATYKSPSGSTLEIGGAPNYRWPGKIDEVIIYNQTLSNSEVYNRFIGFDDGTAPTFSGLESATDAQTGGAVDLSWSAASDPTSITYSVFYSSTSGGQNFSNAYTTTNTTFSNVTGLTNDQIYYFVVRANDVFGNEDTNTVEKSATPTAP